MLETLELLTTAYDKVVDAYNARQRQFKVYQTNVVQMEQRILALTEQVKTYASTMSKPNANLVSLTKSVEALRKNNRELQRKNEDLEAEIMKLKRK